MWSEITDKWIPILTLAGILLTVYKSWERPNKRQDKAIGEMKVACNLKHKQIDANQTEIKGELAFIRDNHLKHIEASMAEMRTEQATIRTILDERLPKKQ